MPPRTGPVALASALLLGLGSPAVAACPPDGGLTAIAAVQGSGTRSPLAGREVRVQGVVTADVPGLGGFFVQDPRPSGDPSASGGLFVRLAGSAVRSPPVGETVRVAGTVAEVGGMTELTAPTGLRSCGRGTLPAPRPIGLPLPGPAGWEALEGMRVRIDVPLTVTDVYQVARYGEMTLAAGRLFAASQGAPPPAGGGGSVVLDDGSDQRDPRPVPYRFPDGLPPRVGDLVRGLTAVVMEAHGGYRLEPTAPPELVRANPRPPAPAAVGGDVEVASFNVHNLFTTLGDRGARSAAERRLQRAKVARVLAGLHADVIALEEVENDGMRTERALVDAVNAVLGSDAYAAVPDPAAGVGTDRIKQAILYRRDRWTLLRSASDPRPVFERAPVAATFRSADGTVLTVVAVHLKSKGGCPAAGDVDRGNGCWDLRRNAQAQAVIDFAAELQRSSGSPDLVVAGDLNSYAGEPPLQLFRAAGYRNADALVPAAQRYSYVYMGRSGTLDYLLASPALAGRLSGATIWHIDADEPPLPGTPAASDDVYRTSDHDPVLLGIRGVP